jgi:hypothetical protein
MAINTFCTTLCAALVTLAAAPALAFDLAPEPAPANAATAAVAITGGDAYRSGPAARQGAGAMVFDTTTFGDMADRPLMLAPAALPGTEGGNDANAQSWLTSPGGLALRLNGPEASQPVPASETRNLPLLGAAAIALLLAQLRRSQRPAVR